MVSRRDVFDQRNSRRPELLISKKFARKVGTRSRQCRPKVPGRLAFPGARILEFEACSDSGNLSSSFPGTFPAFSSGTPEQTPANSQRLLELSALRFSKIQCQVGQDSNELLLRRKTWEPSG